MVLHSNCVSYTCFYQFIFLPLSFYAVQIERHRDTQSLYSYRLQFTSYFLTLKYRQGNKLPNLLLRNKDITRNKDGKKQNFTYATYDIWLFFFSMQKIILVRLTQKPRPYQFGIVKRILGGGGGGGEGTVPNLVVQRIQSQLFYLHCQKKSM